MGIGTLKTKGDHDMLNFHNSYNAIVRIYCTIKKASTSTFKPLNQNQVLLTIDLKQHAVNSLHYIGICTYVGWPRYSKYLQAN